MPMHSVIQIFTLVTLAGISIQCSLPAAPARFYTSWLFWKKYIQEHTNFRKSQFGPPKILFRTQGPGAGNPRLGIAALSGSLCYCLFSQHISGCYLSRTSLRVESHIQRNAEFATVPMRIIL